MKKMAGYILAMITGVFPGVYTFTDSVFTGDGVSFYEKMVSFALLLVAYAIISIIFGFVGDMTSWRWGIWIGIPADLMMIVNTVNKPGNFLPYMFYIAMITGISCLFSYLGARMASWEKRSGSSRSN